MVFGSMITRQALGQGPMPIHIGALDAKGKGKGMGKDKPDAEVTCYYCSKVGRRKADCWSREAGSEGGRHAQEGCEKGSGCCGRQIAQGRPTERFREGVLHPVGCNAQEAPTWRVYELATALGTQNIPQSDNSSLPKTSRHAVVTMDAPTWK